MWLDEFETADIRDQLAALWEEVAPLYRQLHAFVRGRLRARYGDQVVSRGGPIPAHLLGEAATGDTPYVCVTVVC